DIFFYGLSESKASEVLAKCVTLLVTAVDIKGYDANYPDYQEVRIERGAKYVNVSFTRKDELHNMQTTKIYQFILRICPALDSIVGGFDIPMSSFCWNGHDFLGTPIAVFCATQGILVANLSRRSPSFEHRLVKYCQRFNLLLYFPGLNGTTFWDK